MSLSKIDVAVSKSLHGLPALKKLIAASDHPHREGEWLIETSTKRLGDSERVTILNVFDRCTEQWLTSAVIPRAGRSQVVSALEETIIRYGRPMMVSTPNSLGVFDLMRWGAAHKIDIDCLPPNERLHKLRLIRTPNGERWGSLEEVQRVLDKWRHEFNRRSSRTVH